MGLLCPTSQSIFFLSTACRREGQERSCHRPGKVPPSLEVAAYGRSNQVAFGDIEVGWVLCGSKQRVSVWDNKTLIGVSHSLTWTSMKKLASAALLQ